MSFCHGVGRGQGVPEKPWQAMGGPGGVSSSLKFAEVCIFRHSIYSNRRFKEFSELDFCLSLQVV